MNMLLAQLFRHFIIKGNLKVLDSDGEAHLFGDASGRESAIRFTDMQAEQAFATDPELTMGELYMDERLLVETGNLENFLDIIFQNMRKSKVGFLRRLHKAVRYVLRHYHQYNSTPRSKSNVAHHYDLNGDLYRLFLDDDMQYSCAYFENEKDTLDVAQLAKKRHLAAKLYARKGDTLLDIGSGWGGMGLYCAKYLDMNVTGITLSKEQYQVSLNRAWSSGLSDHLQFQLKDYRHVNDQFDRILSVGMFEHVGAHRYGQFFNKCASLLKEDGVMVLHSIGYFGGPSSTNPWINKYIFPGGYIPSLSELFPAIERSGLMVADVEVLRLHYAKTLHLWRKKLQKIRDQVEVMYDARFCRMWDFYLTISEESFRHGDLMVFQLQLVKNINSLPITRSYIHDFESHPPDQRESGVYDLPRPAYAGSGTRGK